jgi:hypothetical protein
VPSVATQCLILYHPEDLERVLQVKAALAGLNLAAWVDVEDLDPGRLTVEQWEEAVRAHPHVFLFWSAAAARDPRRIMHRYLMALEEHGSVVPVCLDEAELPPALKPYWPIAGAGALPAAALACLIEATVAGRRLLTGPNVQLVDIPWGTVPGGPLAIWAVRPWPGQTVTPELLREVLVKAGEGPALILCPHGGATGASRGELAIVIEEHCPPATAVVVSFDAMPYNEIPDRQQVQPAGDARTAWPVTAVWAGGQPVYQVDLGAPAGLARVGPRIPVFRTPCGFTFSLLTMAPAAGDPAGMPGTLAGLFARGLCNLPDGPERLDLCLLLTPDAAWEAPAREVLLAGVGGRPVGCGVVFSHAAGVSRAGGPEPYREAGACVYRMTLGAGEEHRYHAIFPGGGLGPEEPALPLRQLVKGTAQPLFPYDDVLASALDKRFRIVREAILDQLTEERRQVILELLQFPGEPDRQAFRGIDELLRVLAKLALGGELDLAREDARNTALWAERTLVAVLNGSRNARPSQLVADFCSRLYQRDERAEFSPYGQSVVLVEHFGVCDGVRTYNHAGFAGEFTVTEELRRETAPVVPETRYCGLSTLQSLLDGCTCEDEARTRLREVG